MLIIFEFKAWQDYVNIEKTDRKTFAKINRLIKDIVTDAKNGIGKPEPLKHDLKDYFSRRIDKQNRIIYKATDNEIIIISVKGHYFDK